MGYIKAYVAYVQGTSVWEVQVSTGWQFSIELFCMLFVNVFHEHISHTGTAFRIVPFPEFNPESSPGTSHENESSHYPRHQNSSSNRRNMLHAGTDSNTPSNPPHHQLLKRGGPWESLAGCSSSSGAGTLRRRASSRAARGACSPPRASPQLPPSVALQMRERGH